MSQVANQKRDHQKNDHTPILELREASKSFGVREALVKVSLSIGADERILLLGANGSGKSTLLRTLAGIHRPTSGVRVLDGKILKRHHFKEFAYSGHENQLYEPLTVRENLKLFSELRGKEIDTDSLLNVWNLTSVADVAVSSLSRGNEARVVLARAISAEARFLLLDEPTTALDDTGRQVLIKALEGAHNAKGATIIATHDIRGFSGFANRIIVMKQGCVVRQIGGRHSESELLAIYSEACL